jgi:hypothetical protein
MFLATHKHYHRQCTALSAIHCRSMQIDLRAASINPVEALRIE